MPPRSKPPRVARPSRRRNRTPVNVGFIGAGSLSTTYHYPSLTAMPDVRIAAVCDLIRGKAEANARQFGIPQVYTDYREMLEKERLDAVYIVMPPQDSFDLLHDCLSRGLHTFSEKPPTVTTFQCKALAEIARRQGCVTQIGFQRKSIPLLKTLRRRVEERGPIDQFFVEFVKAKPQGGLYYNGRIDVLTCDAIHMVDTAVWLGGGTLPAIASVVRQSFRDQNVKFNALMRFGNDVSGFFSANWNSGRRHLAAAIHGQNCCALIDNLEEGGTYFDPEHPEGVRLTAVAAAGSERPERVLGFFDENREFIDAVRAGDPKATGASLQQSVVTMETVDRILCAELAAP